MNFRLTSSSRLLAIVALMRDCVLEGTVNDDASVMLGMRIDGGLIAFAETLDLQLECKQEHLRVSDRQCQRRALRRVVSGYAAYAAWSFWHKERPRDGIGCLVSCSEILEPHRPPRYRLAQALCFGG